MLSQFVFVLKFTIMNILPSGPSEISVLVELTSVTPAKSFNKCAASVTDCVCRTNQSLAGTIF